MRPLDETEVNAVAGGPAIIIEPDCKANEPAAEDAGATAESDK